MKKCVLLVIIPVFFLSCSSEEKRMSMVTTDYSGITFENTLSSKPDLNILNYLYYYNGGGVVIADFNQDGLNDIFFTANENNDELYVNKGGLTFDLVNFGFGNIQETGWSTGVTHVDINGDGRLDIYICKASGFANLTGHNLLYLNKGNNGSGEPIFEEVAAQFGLDISTMATQATFFDYDGDGDLDMFLLNHSVYPNRNYGVGSLRKGFHPIYGDRLYENRDGYFEEVSDLAGIYQGKIGYGLGLAIGDLNQDNTPDIYIGNDFYEIDYLYLNKGDKTFEEKNAIDDKFLGHTTHFSMGNTLEDFNNDGYLDILSTDMLPEDMSTYKTSGLEYGFPIYRQYLNKGYAPQYMQNTLHLSNSGQFFSEVAALAGIDATEWSWSPVAADFDLDGYTDLYITNGIKGATNDMDYMNFIANEDIQRRIDAGMTEGDLPLINEIPEKKKVNYFFQNNGNGTFQDVSKDWAKGQPSFSNGAAYGDLDNDGDLDIVVNNVNAPAFVIENKTNGNYIKLKFKGNHTNTMGVGTKVWLYKNGVQYQENHPTKGYLSAVPPELVFGLGKDSLIDSIRVRWPQGQHQLLKNVKGNQTIVLYEKVAIKRVEGKSSFNPFFTKMDSLVPFLHKEGVPLDFDRQPLIPFGNSNNGPCLSIADFDKNGFPDVFVGGAKRQTASLYMQTVSGEMEETQDEFHSSSIREDVVSVVFDANGDGWEDLLVAGGGNEFTKGNALQPTLYLNHQGRLKPINTLPTIEMNMAHVQIMDLEKDGDLDIIWIVDTAPGGFGTSPSPVVWKNDGDGTFTSSSTWARGLERIGNIKDTELVDFDKDGLQDLLVVGHWMPITLLRNTGSGFEKQEVASFENTEGWWNTLSVADVNQDGNLDFIAGNWGENTKFQASTNKPMYLYLNDFDQNGTQDPVVTYYWGDQETPFSSKDELVKQMPFLNKKFLSYEKFAQASMTDLFGETLLNEAKKKKVVELKSCVFLGTADGSFQKIPLPFRAQESQINAIHIEDFNKDGYPELVTGGNNFIISTQLGRLDACHGKIWWNTKNRNNPYKEYESLYVDGVIQQIQPFELQNKKVLIIGRNDDATTILTPNEN